jgi:small subunit ribosomal protein S19e
MVSALDVEPNRLIEKAAQMLKSQRLQKPDFVGLVKTGSHVQRPPQQENFWYIRCASIMRHAYINNVVGTGRLRRHYGGRKSRGVKPQKHAKTGGSTIRKAMQQLEKSGLMVKEKTGGRRLTAKGVALLDGAAKEVNKSGG